MSQELGVVLMMNNYFHDVATALLFASGVTMWFMLRAFEANEGAAATRAFLAMQRSMKRLALFSLAWIVLGGFPRAIYYQEFEWTNAAGRLQIPALVVKHVVMFALVAGGATLWLRLRKRAAAYEERAIEREPRFPQPLSPQGRGPE